MNDENKILNYFEELGNLHQKISITGENGKSYSFSQAIQEMMDKISYIHQQGNKIIFIGNGGSSAIASHMAIDYWKNGGMRATCFNDPAQLTCLGNDYGYEHTFGKPIQMFANAGDLLVAISSSGRSPNILNGTKMAKEKSCQIITLSGFSEDNPLRKMGKINFYVPSNSYGYVEITHLTICHAVLDLLMENKK